VCDCFSPFIDLPTNDFIQLTSFALQVEGIEQFQHSVKVIQLIEGSFVDHHPVVAPILFQELTDVIPDRYHIATNNIKRRGVVYRPKSLQLKEGVGGWSRSTSLPYCLTSHISWVINPALPSKSFLPVFHVLGAVTQF
jgi:hypothetical protein